MDPRRTPLRRAPQGVQIQAPRGEVSLWICVGPHCAGPPRGGPGPTQAVQIQAPRGEVSLWICVGPHCAFLRKIMGWKEESLVGRSLSLGYQHVRAPTHWPLKAPHHYL